MPKYRVEIIREDGYIFYVDAENKDAAKEKALAVFESDNPMAISRAHKHGEQWEEAYEINE